MERVVDLVAYWFGEVTDAERDRIEEAMMADPTRLAEYFALKRHFERGSDEGPSPHVRDRLEEDLFDNAAPRRRHSRAWSRRVGAGLLAAAAVVAVWLLVRADFTPLTGTLVDTARPRAESGNTL